MLEGDTRKKEKSNQTKVKKRFFTRAIEQTRVRCGPSDRESSDVVRIREVSKGVRWMPRLPEAMKDVTSCEKPGVAANEH